MDDDPAIVGTGAHLDAEELRAWTSLLDAARILDTELEHDLVEHHHMSHREYEILVRLDGWGGSLRMSELAHQVEASAPLISQTVARLEERGWVERRRDPDDLRGVRAVLCEPGRRALAEAAVPHAAIIRSLLIDRLGDDLEGVAAALGAVADHLRAHRRGEGCGDRACPLEPG